MKKLRSKNCLITGAASGIGRSLAIGLAKEGMNLFLVDLNIDGLQSVKKEIEDLGMKVFISKCDVSKLEDNERIANEAYSKLGEIDLLINNAGISHGSFILDLDLEDDWKKMMDVNLWSIIYSLKVFLPRMLERGSGYIVNTGSGAGVVGLPCHLPYIAVKFAVSGITEGLQSELHDSGLNFSVICPTLIKTNIIDRSDIKIPPNLLTSDDPEEIKQKLDEFKREFWKRYSEDGLTPDQAAKKYIKGIKKNKLYIFDKKILPVAMFIKGISRKLYRRVLKRLGREYLELIDNVLLDIGAKT
jgi:short-subunit dehydrogenase